MCGWSDPSQDTFNHGNASPRIKLHTKSKNMEDVAHEEEGKQLESPFPGSALTVKTRNHVSA